MSANLLSMGAVDFGVIVDGGVVIIEAILVALAASRATTAVPQRRSAFARRPSEVVRPTVFALLIIIAAYLPIFMLRAGRGAHLLAHGQHRGRARSLGALLFSVTLVPVLASFALRQARAHRESPVLTLAQRALRPGAASSR